jgi:hypothetical protein
LLTDRDEMSNLNRGPSIDASYHVSAHLAKVIFLLQNTDFDYLVQMFIAIDINIYTRHMYTERLQI